MSIVIPPAFETAAATSPAPARPTRLAIVLHAHTPFVPAPARRHGHADALYASVAQSVVPLLNVLQRLADEETHAPITLAVSPIWCEMMSDLSLPVELEKYLHRHIELCRAHGREFAAHGQETFRALALFWENWYLGIERDYEDKFGRDLMGALAQLQNDGRIELLAVPATGAFLPALPDESAVAAQLQIGIESYKKHFATHPRGVWLPAARGDDAGGIRLARELARRGFDYCIHGAPCSARDDATRSLASREPFLRALLGGDAGFSTAGALSGLTLVEGVAALRPHPALTEQVWNQELGYCGDEQFLDDARRHHPGDLRLWRITDDNGPPSRREPYEPFGNLTICEAQAAHWLERARELDVSGAPLCAAFEAEFFGAHWFEGHNWLYRTLKKAASDPNIELVSASEATSLAGFDLLASADNAVAHSEIEAAPSLWFNTQTSWLWPEIEWAHGEMKRAVKRYQNSGNAKLDEILEQCAREVLLMQSFDWPLSLSTRATSEAASRFAEHADTLRCLLAIAQTVAGGEFMSEGERAFLEAARDRDDLFAEVSLALWAI